MMFFNKKREFQHVVAAVLVLGCSIPNAILAAEPASSSVPFVGAAVATTAAPLEIRYVLKKAQRVSVNIYDQNGQVVRELLHAAPRLAGANLELWDGRDGAGLPVPAGKYGYKLLATPGLKIEYLLSVGSNYAVDPKGPWWAMAPGCHGGPQAMAADKTGIYISGFSENIETALLKQSLDGKTRLWSAQCPDAWEAGSSLAVIGDRLYTLTGKNRYWIYESETGKKLKAIDVKQGEEGPADMTSDGDKLVFAYPKAGVVRWLEPSTGVESHSVAVPGASALGQDAKGNVYCLANDSLVLLRQDTATARPLATDLKDAQRLTVDKDGSVLVWLGGAEQRIVRLDGQGKPLGYFGVAGGRPFGLYQGGAQQSFRDVADIEAFPGGGFLVAEPNAAPRRVALFDGAGKLVDEWYGGQVWAPWVAPEPDNPSAVWMASSWSDIMRCELDLKSRTWKVHSTYRINGLANGLIPSHTNARLFEVRQHGGNTYLCVLAGPSVLKVDKATWQLKPAAVLLTHLQHYKKEQSAWLQENMGGNHVLAWSDANGDGVPQNDEMTWSNKPAPWTSSWFVDDDLNYYTVHSGKIVRYPVLRWTAAGSPVYGDISAGEAMAPHPARVTSLEPRWGAYLHKDVAGKALYAAFNDMTGWGISRDSLLVKYNEAGQPLWTVGKLGNNPGEINAFRRIAGVVNGCVALTNFSVEWSSERFPKSYVWNEDGLYVGGLFESPKVGDGPLWDYALGGEALAGVLTKDPRSGDVLYYGNWINEGRVYKVTGWDDWEKASGFLQVTAAGGRGGVLAQVWRAGTNTATAPAATMATNKINFSARVDAPALARTGPISVAWRGKLMPPATGTLGLTLRFAGTAQLILDQKTLLAEKSPEPKVRSLSGQVEVTAGQALDLQVTWQSMPGVPAVGGGGVQLLWTPPDATEPTMVPASALLPSPPVRQELSGQGDGIKTEYFHSREIKGEATLTVIEPTLGDSWGKSRPQALLNLYPSRKNDAFGVRWTGALKARETGWHWFTLSCPSPRFLKVDGREMFYYQLGDPRTVNEGGPVWLEAGRYYPLLAEYTSANTHPSESQRFLVNWVEPSRSYYGGATPIPSCQLYSAPPVASEVPKLAAGGR